MQPLIVQYQDFLTFLCHLDKKKKAQVIAALKKREHIECIAEILDNFLRGHLTTEKSIIDQLKRYKGDIKKITLRKTSLAEKKRILRSQRGGNILALLLPLAVNLLTKIIR